ncbi:hypothetical protein PPL_09841 [Heterostelium album PN500]|uniref:B box-type domain-containing protein n=1 Tax=Heterostelium pallidum (strain ATCC 26659 / Pp 5 / PN500) TaxID=670386 RepID=D3BP78_HETP5|nr:hypothetical protein PPL_09841 [Heterostelium album PN500]EFA77088.1 hypothetical protein PPL_09841 [Heterostelium album PN500]|eukprot:XP_020429217.1 hypothetical protein PPL_09841 [Heterostelium album PN500]
MNGSNDCINNSGNTIIKCKNHTIPIDLICYDCVLLLCSQCSPLHRNHHFDHVRNIKSSIYLNQKNNYNLKRCNDNSNTTTNSSNTVDNNDQQNQTLNNSINNNNNNNSIINNNETIDFNNPINNNLQTLWDSLKSSVETFNALKLDEEDVSQHFRDLHQYLITQEYKYKQQITNDIDFVREKIESDIKQFKPLVNIVNTVKYDISTNNNNNNNNTLINSNSNSNNIDEVDCTTTGDEDQNDDGDITYSYQTDGVIDSVAACSTLSEFMSANSQSLFSVDKTKLENVNDDSILDSVYRYLDGYRFDAVTEFEKHLKHYYKVDINQIQTNKIKQNFEKSIQIKRINKVKTEQEKEEEDEDGEQQQQQQQLLKDQTISKVKVKKIPAAINNQLSENKKQVYLVTTDKNGQITKLDVNKNYQEEHLPLQFNNVNTFNSVVTIGEHVYVFGGAEGSKKQFKRFSVKTNIIDLEADMSRVEGERISACYNGKNHIYLLNGNKKSHVEISRYDIETNKFDRFAFLNNTHEAVLLSFFYQDMLYSVCRGATKIIRFNPNNKQRDDISVDGDHIENGSAFCTDGKGNIYIHCLTDQQRFVRFNVIERKVETLNHAINMEILFYLSMVYDPNHDLIYLLGGKEYQNYIYSVKHNSWYNFYSKDESTRYWCGTAIVTL